MKLAEIEKEAVALPQDQRVDLVCKLLETLPQFEAEVSDDAVVLRDQEMENGLVEPLTHEEFVRRVRKERR